MNTGRGFATATLLPGGKVLMAGGGLFSGALSSTELYDPVTNRFSITARMNVARQLATATLLLNGKVLIAAGFDFMTNPAGSSILASTELYDPVTNTFAPPTGTASMNAARFYATATLLPNGKVLIAGGFDVNENPLASTELYDPAANTFAANPAMRIARGWATATLLPNGKVLIAGGYFPSGGIFMTATSTELYDPVTNTFAFPIGTASMKAGRAQAMATLLANGKVLIVGGFEHIPGELFAVTSTELYDPAANTFAAATATMNDVREGSTITLLPNGKVLIAGRDGGLSTTELYTP
jgi:hypothetical protein